MLTAQEIRSTSFEIGRRGYTVEDVDAFLKKVASEVEALQTETVAMLQEKDQQIQALTNEKREMEDKMLVIADKLEEYRSQETLLQNALLNAEKMKESLLGEARQTSEILIRDAQQKAEKILESANSRVVNEEQSYLRMQQEVAKFKNQVLDIYKSHLAVLNSLPSDIEDGMGNDRSYAAEQVHGEEVANEVKEEMEQAQASLEEQPAVEEVNETVVETIPETVEEAAENVVEDVQDATESVGNVVEEVADAVEESVAEAVEEVAETVDAAEEKYDGFAPRGANEEKKKSRFNQLDFGDKFSFGK